MKVSLNRRTLTATVLMAAIAASAFRADNTGNGSALLRKISTPSDKTIITYNADKSIAKMITTHHNGEDHYTSVRIPVYEAGKLVKTMVADDEAASSPALFSSYDYNPAGSIARISYYTDNQVSAYDSLVYNEQGQLSARYYFAQAAGKTAFESHNCQLYTWDQQGNISLVENMGRLQQNGQFVLSAAAAYRYDNKINAQQRTPVYAWITDLSPMNLSAHNVVAEVIKSAGSDRTISNSFEYTYTNQQYPTHVTAKFSGSKATVATELEWE